MKIIDLEFSAPNPNIPIGILKFGVEIPILSADIVHDHLLKDNESLDVEFGEETVETLEKLKALILNDIYYANSK